MHLQTAALLLGSVLHVVAQSVVGEAYGFATGVTGGGSATAVTPADAEELASLLSDDEARVILIDKEYDFTGDVTTGAGCTRTTCTIAEGGQYFLGDLSCGGSDNVVDNAISYDAAGNEPLVVGSNKSIVGVGGKGVLKGKGLKLASGASNVIIQGLEITTINPSVVWGGDAIDLQGGNDGVWVDHCKISLIGRMFVVSHYDAVRLTLSNNEFDGVTTTSSSCNDDHYWTMMFYGDGDQVTLDKNYFHDVSGRAPKLGQDGVSGTFQASNNYFSNMQGHAFDAYNGATALIEGNVFEGVKQPTTDAAAGVSTLYTVPDEAAATACESSLGRACVLNNVDSSSGDLAAVKGGLSTLANVKNSLVTPVEASEVAAYVKANAGPANVGASGSSGAQEEVATPSATAPIRSSTSTVSVPSIVPVTTSEAATPKPSSSTPSVSADAVSIYGQCGGNGYSGSTTCASGATCTKYNDWYSQCVPGSAKFRRAIKKHRSLF